MYTRASYREIVKEVLLKYSAMKPSNGNIRVDAVFDEQRDRYALIYVGWNDGRRIHGNVIYITLDDEHVYLEHDGLGYGIADELIEKGISEDRLVFAYYDEPAAITSTVQS